MQSDGVLRAWIRHAGQALRRADRPLNFEVAAEPRSPAHVAGPSSSSAAPFIITIPLTTALIIGVVTIASIIIVAILTSDVYLFFTPAARAAVASAGARGR
jgi:hypothetical protein